MNYPKISIVTPNYNGAKYLEETILSVLDQNYPNLEYIIIDGGSTDNSISIIKKYEDQLAFWMSEPDNGMYHAIQKGFDRSTGEIMAWINSDDMYHRNAFFTVAEIFSSFTQVNWLLGAASIFDIKGRTINIEQSRIFSKFDFLNQDYGWIQQESIFWRRTLWERAGESLNINLKYAGDFELWLKFIKSENLYVTNALLGGFRWQGKNQLSVENKDEYFNEVKKIYSKLQINSKDKSILTKYKIILFLEKLIQKLKIFRTGWLIRKFKFKYFGPPEKIVYDSNKLEFKIIKHNYLNPRA